MTSAVVVGSGPNGLAAAVVLARAGIAVTVLERADHPGGGASTRQLTLPGFAHDVCSAVHPLAVASPFFQAFGLGERVELLTPDISYAQPIGRSEAAVAYRDLERTVAFLGADGPAWRRMLGPLAEHADQLSALLADPVSPPPETWLTAARFGLRVLQQGGPWWNAAFRGEAAPALLAGVFGHSVQRMPRLGSAAAGLVLAAFGHVGGWPVPRGGSGAIAQALVDDLLAHRGRLELGVEVSELPELADYDIAMLDVTPRAFAELAGPALPAPFERALRAFRYGNAAAKVDFALAGAVPWTNPELRRAATVHLGGTRADVARAAAEVARGRHAEHPYVIVSQPGVIDPSRAPEGKQTLWAYAHVPAGSERDQAEAVTREIERYAPGFRDLVLAVSSRSAAQIEQQNPNYIGGDIGAGAATAWQLLARPRLSAHPWRTPLRGVYLCSASTAPGPGVHGLSGWAAAREALADLGAPMPDLSPEGPA